MHFEKIDGNTNAELDRSIINFATKINPVDKYNLRLEAQLNTLFN